MSSSSGVTTMLLKYTSAFSSLAASSLLGLFRDRVMKPMNAVRTVLSNSSCTSRRGSPQEELKGY